MEKIKIIVDTDLGSDCDDAGAIALLHRFADEGIVDILAITHCTSDIGGAYSVKAINEWYNRPDIPIGRYDTAAFLDDEKYKKFTRVIMNQYLENHKECVFENSVKLLRKALSENNDVTIVTIGMFNNIAELLKSKPDEISRLNGKELVEKSVSRIYAMAGNFSDFNDAEYNVASDFENAKYVSQNTPCPIYYCGFELGFDIITGMNLAEHDYDNPVKKIYFIHNNRGLRPSWDPITVYCALLPNNPLFKKEEGKKITFKYPGCVVIEDGGKDSYYVKQKNNAEIQAEIDKWIY